MASPMARSPLGSPSQAKQPQVYQIDFTAVASGKRIASTKRRVRWRFGFANTEALAAGQTGTDCRGEEHDVTIVWSITSGKRLVLADGQEVHYSNSRNSVLDFSWTMRGNHVLKVVAHASPPLSAQPGFRQYDFFVDGQSFFTFPKVFRLGLAPNDPRGASSPRSPPNMADRGRSFNEGGNYATQPYQTTSVRSAGSANIAAIEAPNNPDEEEAYLQEAIKNSLKETATPAAARPAITSGTASVQSRGADSLLLDFMTPDPAPAPALPPSTSSYASNNNVFGIPPAYAALPPSTTPANTSVYGNPPSGTTDSWGSSAYGAPVLAPQPASNTYGAQDSLVALPYGGQPAPAHISYGNYAYGGGPYGGPPPPEPLQTPVGGQVGQNEFTSPPPTSIAAPQQGYTPATQASSIGFASPVAQMYGGPPQGQEPQMNGFEQQPSSQDPFGMNGNPYGMNGYGEPTPASSDAAQAGFPGDSSAPAPEPVAQAPSDPALFNMNVLSGSEQPLVTEDMKGNNGSAAGGSMADQAYAKLVNMDAFDLVQDKSSQSRKNPFEVASTTSNNTASLADIMKSKNKIPEKKEIMKSHAPAPGAMVLSSTQQGNFGGYGNQYGVSGMGMGQQPQPAMNGMGGPPSAPSMQAYGGMPQQYGQPPPSQPYGYPQAYGIQQQAPPMQQGIQQQVPPMQQQYGMQQPQQSQYGQPPPMQPSPYGQHPPMQQQPFGF